FYEAAGETFPLRLSLPRGRHELEWTWQRRQKSFLSILNAIPRRVLWGIGISELVLVAACVVLLVQVRGLRSAIPAPRDPMPRFWKSFLAGGKSTVVVVPSPLYFFWPAHHTYVRDLEISDFT